MRKNFPQLSPVEIQKPLPGLLQFRILRAFRLLREHVPEFAIIGFRPTHGNQSLFAFPGEHPHVIEVMPVCMRKINSGVNPPLPDRLHHVPATT